MCQQWGLARAQLRQPQPTPAHLVRVRGPADVQLPSHAEIHDQGVHGTEVGSEADSQAIQRHIVLPCVLHPVFHGLNLWAGQEADATVGWQLRKGIYLLAHLAQHGRLPLSHLLLHDRLKLLRQAALAAGENVKHLGHRPLLLAASAATHITTRALPERCCVLSRNLRRLSMLLPHASPAPAA